MQLLVFIALEATLAMTLVHHLYCVRKDIMPLRIVLNVYCVLLALPVYLSNIYHY